LTTDNLVLKWVVSVIESLCDGKFTGGVQIWFKNGGISSITRPNPDKVTKADHKFYTVTFKNK
jgi:hypothetical protein